MWIAAEYSEGDLHVYNRTYESFHEAEEFIQEDLRGVFEEDDMPTIEWYQVREDLWEGEAGDGTQYSIRKLKGKN